MGPTKEDLDRFRIEIMTGGRSEDMNMEKENEQLQTENTKLKQDNEQLRRMLNFKEELDKREIPYEWHQKSVFDLIDEITKLKQDKQELQQENTSLQYENITLRSDFEAQAELTKKHKDKLNNIKEELLIWGEVINPTLQENILLTIESKE